MGLEKKYIEEILRLYEISDRNISRAVEIFNELYPLVGVSRGTVRRYWKNEGYETRGPGGQKHWKVNLEKKLT
jgi:hypothetical protein